ncbi:MAG: aspartate aminotransferase family protein [Planctomycetes bacterium RBG_16_64_10]|nr:MAG: aspartate aminotransferase family protein [Planctomycetes bacterium RBG_16_64_10]
MHAELLRTEGDLNVGVHRRAWQDAYLDDYTRQRLAADAAVFLHQSLSTPCLNALVGCEGIYLIDAQGRRIMDFHGNNVHQVGYRHPRVVAAVKRQLDRLPFCPRRYANEPATALAERLAELAPGRLQKVLLAPAGTTAIGMALKLVRYATGRHKTISMWDAFHGASLDAISIGGEALFRDDVGPLLPGCFHVLPPRADDALDEAVGLIERLLDEQGDIAAVIAEPVRCTTVQQPPEGYWPRVRQLCDAHGALLVFDEIALALGRTGRMFCCEHFAVEPDILVIGKGLGGGIMPIAALVTRADLDVGRDRAIGHYTHEKSPVGAAAALATIDVIEHEHLLEHATQLGAYAVQQLEQLRARHPLVAAVRGLGLLVGVELRRGQERAVDEAERVMYACLAAGLSFKVSDGNVLTLTPPLTITRGQLDAAVAILDQGLHRVQSG